jgi:hypothetical protein
VSWDQVPCGAGAAGENRCRAAHVATERSDFSSHLRGWSYERRCRPAAVPDFAFAGAVAGPFQIEEARATASVVIERGRTERARKSLGSP